MLNRKRFWFLLLKRTAILSLIASVLDTQWLITPPGWRFVGILAWHFLQLAMVFLPFTAFSAAVSVGREMLRSNAGAKRDALKLTTTAAEVCLIALLSMGYVLPMLTRVRTMPITYGTAVRLGPREMTLPQLARADEVQRHSGAAYQLYDYRGMLRSRLVRAALSGLAVVLGMLTGVWARWARTATASDLAPWVVGLTL